MEILNVEIARIFNAASMLFEPRKQHSPWICCQITTLTRPLGNRLPNIDGGLKLSIPITLGNSLIGRKISCVIYRVYARSLETLQLGHRRNGLTKHRLSNTFA